MLYNIFDMNGTMVKYMISLREVLHFLTSNSTFLLKKEFEKEFNKSQYFKTKDYLIVPFSVKEV